MEVVLNMKTAVPARMLALGVLSSLMGLLFFQTFLRLRNEWDTNIYYSHGYLMIPLAVWLLWRKRATLMVLPMASTWKGLPLLLVGLALYVVGVRADILFAQGVALMAVLAGTVYTLAGPAIFKASLFPIGILGFMIPLPYLVLDPIGFPMKSLAASASAGVLQAAGVPIVPDGVYLYLPGYTLVVEDICNGLRSLISMTMVGTVLAYISLPSNRERWLLVLLSIPISLVANIIRILITALLGYYVSDQLAQGFLHELSGLFVFLVSFGGLLLMERVLSWKSHERITGPLSA